MPSRFPRDRRRLAAATAGVLSLGALVILLWKGGAALHGHLLPPDDDAVISAAEVTQQFGLHNPLVWVVSPRSGTIWSQVPLEHVRDLTREVLRVPGVIATEVLSIASPNVRDMAVSETSMGSAYLMAEVPRGESELTELRRRVESNPHFRGTLVSDDGRAALIVADFRSDADFDLVAAAALRLRDAHRDATTDVWVAGETILRRKIAGEIWLLAFMTTATVAVACIAFAVVAGTGALARAAIATVITALWTAAALALIDGLWLPWVAQAGLPLVGIIGAMAVPGDESRRNAVALAVAIGFAAMGIVTEGPARSLAVAGCIGTVAAHTAMRLTESMSAAPRRALRAHTWWRDPALLILLFCLFGLAGVHGSYSAFGYGVRYLPEAAAADLRAIARHFPPPTSLVVRARGEAEFVKSPEVLRGFDNIAARARSDRATLRAMSLADLVKMVHQAFNEGLAEYHTIPDDALTVGRLITMGYSSGFRRFVDRSLSEAAIWVDVAGDDPADLTRLHATLEDEFASLALPGVDFAVAGGDGVLALRGGAIARSVALGWLAFAVVAALVVAFRLRMARGVRCFAGACAGGAICYGLYGWMGVPIDLLTLTGIGAATAIGLISTVLDDRIHLPVTLAACAPAAAVFSHLAGSMLGYAFAAPLVAPLLVCAILPPDQSPDQSHADSDAAKYDDDGRSPAGLTPSTGMEAQ